MQRRHLVRLPAPDAGAALRPVSVLAWLAIRIAGWLSAVEALVRRRVVSWLGRP